MRIRKKILLLSAALALLCVLSGCWGSRELDSLGIVMGMALDKAGQEDQIELTIQLAGISRPEDPPGQKASKGGAVEGAQAYINLTETGPDVFSAIQTIEHKLSRVIYVPHNQLVIIGKELAKEGVRDAFDFFLRMPEMRATFYVACAEAAAEELLNADTDFENMPALEIYKIIEDQSLTSEAPIVTFYQFIGDLVASAEASVLPLISVIDEGGIRRASVSGCAVFKHAAYVGELGRAETRGYLRIASDMQSGVINVDVLGERAALKINHSRCKVTPELKDGSSVLIRIDVEEACLLETHSGPVNLAHIDNIGKVEDEAGRIVKSEIEAAVALAQEMEADIFGFSETLRRRYPAEWETMQYEWDELFRELEVKVSVKAKVTSTGKLSRPIYPQED